MYLWVKNIPETSKSGKKDSNLPPWISTPILLPTMILTTAVIIIHKFYRKHLVQYPTVSSIPPSVFNHQQVLSGLVTSVGDADNFRFFHMPGGFLAGWGWIRRVPSVKKELKDQTIHVRLAGIDAPELSHFGKEAQPYGKEAMDWLTSYILGKHVQVRVLSRDRYERVVGEVKVRQWPFFWIKRNVSLEMLKRGLAEVYKSKGAEYGGKISELKFHREERKAKKKRIGIWKQSTKTYESPAEYKHRMNAITHTSF